MIAHMICFRVNSIIFYPSGFSYQTSYSYKDISLFMYHKKRIVIYLALKINPNL